MAITTNNNKSKKKTSANTLKDINRSLVLQSERNTDFQTLYIARSQMN